MEESRDAALPPQDISRDFDRPVENPNGLRLFRH
jgi:hypothetical protein